MKLTFLSTAKKHKRNIFVTFCIIAVILFWNSTPSPLFKPDYSRVLYDSCGQLLNVTIAKDQQWRFPPVTHLPEKYVTSLINFEDKRFYKHLGIDFYSVGRALIQNTQNTSTVSGASTISMQVMRMACGNLKRTYFQKTLEIILALRLEMGCSKERILSYYANNAPFGGNIVGIDAASWRYFGHSARELSWAESAMLAVLPNSPSLIRLDKNRHKLKSKRNRLLLKLFNNNIIDSTNYSLAIEEPLPQKYHDFPQDCPIIPDNQNMSDSYRCSIDRKVQRKLNAILLKHYKQHLKGNNTQNACAVIIENRTNKIVGYAGNIVNFSEDIDNMYVDIAESPRSTGSILKPFLYAALLSEGDILPKSLIADVPTAFKSFAPKNYNKGYDGAVPANMALARSLNVPAVFMLQQYGNERFLYLLQKAGMTSLNYSSDHYGLSLILGGCEGKLLEIASIYSNMAHNLLSYTENDSRYFNYSYKKPQFSADYQPINEYETNSTFSASAIYYTFKALLDVERPDEESYWEKFKSSEKIAWKTGTSFGFKDAWAIGLTPRYTVGVWTGNADGEGNPSIIGVKSSAPILFDIFNFLPRSERWFDMPYDDMVEVKVCPQSGMLASQYCPISKKMNMPALAENSKACPFHQKIFLNKDKTFRIKQNCYTQEITDTSWLVLPAHWAYYYSKRHAFYQPLPPYHPQCENEMTNTGKMPIKVVYPYNKSKIYIPTELQGTKGQTVFEAVHQMPEATLFWYIDNNFVSATKEIHKIAISPSYGSHLLTITDNEGNSIKKLFEITNKE